MKHTLYHTLAAVIALAAHPALHGQSVVAAWDLFDNTPDYLTGSDSVDQSGVLAGERRGSIFDVVTDKGGASKQASRQSTDGSFGNASGLLNYEGNAISPSAVASALRLNDLQALSLTFTNVSGGPVQLGTVYFDYGRSNDTAPTTITLSFIDSSAVSTILLTDSTTPNTGSIGDYQDFSFDLSAYTIADGDFFTLRFGASNGSTGGNLDNVALTVVVPEPSSVGIFIGLMAMGVVILRRRAGTLA